MSAVSILVRHVRPRPWQTPHPSRSPAAAIGLSPLLFGERACCPALTRSRMGQPSAERCFVGRSGTRVLRLYLTRGVPSLLGPLTACHTEPAPVKGAAAASRLETLDRAEPARRIGVRSGGKDAAALAIYGMGRRVDRASALG